MKLTMKRESTPEFSTNPSEQYPSDQLAVLACFAIRFALEFNPILDNQRNIEHTLVEDHMRICLSATPGFFRAVTVSSSEPFLAESAVGYMAEMDLARQLTHHLDNSGVVRGTTGELSAMLLFMQARDAAAKKSKGRIISVTRFLQHLLAESAHEDLNALRPAFSREGEDKPSSETFKNSRCGLTISSRSRIGRLLM